jgi:molybdopterin molybdotransferase
VLLKKGTRIGYVEIGVLASMGRIQVPVYRRPRVVLLTSGDEVVEPGRPLPPGKIYNSNQSVLAARLMEFGIEPYQIAWIRDDAKEMAAALTEAAHHADLIITTGAVSVGKKDIMHEALRLAGADRIFWRVKMKPGMPTLFSVCQGVPVVSLSGNPFGVAVTMELLVRPVLRKMTQDAQFDIKRVSGTMASTFSKGGKGRRFVRASWKDGQFYLPDGLHSNGVLASMAGCNCLLDLPAGTPPLAPGDHAEALLL